jgi:RimK family alpha-L-glutamate ligase
MKVAILSAERGWHTDELQRALAARGVASDVWPVDGLVGRAGGAEGARLEGGGRALDDVDGVLVRILPRGSLEQVVYRVDALHRLERLGIPVVNPARAIERTVDKFLTTTLLDDAGLPTPPTVVAERLDDAMRAFRALGGDVIVKPLFGSNGRGMVRVEDEELAYRVFRALELERAVYYIQRTLPHDGRDVRAFVVGARVVAAAERRAPPTADGRPGWRTNVSRGGTPVRLALPPDWAALAVEAAAVVGAEVAGVDLLPARDGTVYVLEVNGIPGWRGLQTTTDVDIAGTVADHVLARIAARSAV